MGKKFKVTLVEPPGEQRYIPIASAYLVSYAFKDPLIRESFTFNFNFQHFHEPFEEVLEQILVDGPPDIIGFSCQGWALPRADSLARRLRLINPEVTIIYGGNHVSYQEKTFFEERPYLDVLVNAEGEKTFYDFLLSYLQAPQSLKLSDVLGLSYRTPEGDVITTQPRNRISDLSEIPSPYLTGILDVTPDSCGTALLETNRGCPYSCSFCYWGEAIGQKLYCFSEDRLLEEMRFLAKRQIDSWFICDANFGIFPRDAVLVEDIIRLREKYGYPKTVHTNWAKNSNERIVKMCARLNSSGVHSSYTLALQTTTEKALKLANRFNMKINRIQEIANLCRSHNVVPRGELIWGLPGESYNEFLGSYDDLAEHTDALSVYPHYLLPNTEYTTKINEYQITSERGEFDTDYEYCVEHMDMSRNDFIKGLKFVVSNNILKVGGVFFRIYPRVAKIVANIPYSQTIGRLSEWILQSDHPVAARFKKYYRFPLATHRQSLGEVWQACKDNQDGLIDMFRCYVDDMFHAEIEAPIADILKSAFEFDAITYPVIDNAEQEKSVTEPFYIKKAQFDYDFLTLKRGGKWNPTPQHYTYKILSPKGLWQYPMDNWYFGLISYQAQVEIWREE